MTDKVISFKQAKKRAGYAKKEAAAAENRIKFGRTKAEKTTRKFIKEKQAKHLDGRNLSDE